MPERLLKPGPAAWIASSALCVLLIILAILALVAGAGFWLTFLFFVAALAGLWISWLVATAQAAWLRLDEDGFTKKTIISSHRYRWQDVSAFSVAETWPRLAGFSKKVVAFRRLNDRERDHFSQVTDLFDPSRGFSHNYDMEPDHFADLLNDYRNAALRADLAPEAGQKSAENSPQVDD